MRISEFRYCTKLEMTHHQTLEKLNSMDPPSNIGGDALSDLQLSVWDPTPGALQLMLNHERIYFLGSSLLFEEARTELLSIKR